MPPLKEEDNRIDQGYEDGLGSYVAPNVDEAEDWDSNPESQADLSSAEGKPSSAINYTGSKLKEGAKKIASDKAKGGAKSFLKKRGALLGVGGGVAISLLLIGLMAPAAILISFMQNMTSLMDSGSRALSNRSHRVLVNKIEAPDCTEKTQRCQSTKLSNAALRKMKLAGIVALDPNGDPIDTSDKKGFPNPKPTHYKVDGIDNPVAASEIKSVLENNRKIDAKLRGSSGVFNGRLSWNGKHIKKSFREKFGIKTRASLMDGQKGQKFSWYAATDKIAKFVPGYETLGKITEGISSRIDKKISAAKFGGAAYTVAYSSCVASKVPSILTGAIAAAQLARLMPYINEIVLSPAAKLQASGLDSENAATPEDVEFVSSILTQKTRDKDGNLTAAVDSPLLMAAIGVNKGAIDPSVFKNYIPGYSVVDFFNHNPAGTTLKQAQSVMSPACSVIMSPITMITWMITESAIKGVNPVTWAVSLGIQFAVGFAATPVIMAGIEMLLSNEAVQDAIVGDFLKEDLHGIELGHTLGASALAFFPAASMARFVPGVTVGGAEVASQTIKDFEEDQKQLDIALLSPFDISSRHTFLGSIVNTIRMNAIANSSSSLGVLGNISSVLSLPKLAFSGQSVSATNALPSFCSPKNAKYYDLAAEIESDSPLLNPLGLPCGELENTLSVKEAKDILRAEGWLDESKEVSEGADIEALVKAEVIVKDTPLYLLANNETGCNDASTGDYLIEAAGCAVRPSGSADNINIDLSGIDLTECSVSGACEVGSEGDSALSGEAAGASNPKAMLAMYTYLVDIQASNMINGFD